MQAVIVIFCSTFTTTTKFDCDKNLKSTEIKSYCQHRDLYQQTTRVH